MNKILKTVVAAPHTPPYKIHRYFARRPWNVFSEIIRTYSNTGEIVLDPFMGGGVTIYEGLSLDRKVIGYDLNPLSKFIVEIMLEGSLPLSEMDSAYLEIDRFIDSHTFQPEGIGKILWSELTFRVRCNLCGAETLLSNENKIGTGKYRCENKKCTAHTNLQKCLHPKNCERTGRVYLYAVAKNEAGGKTLIAYSPSLVEKINWHVNELLKEIERKNISLHKDLIPLNWDRQLEDQLARKGILYFQDLFTEKNLFLNLLVLDFIKGMQLDDRLKKLMRLVFSASLRETNIMAFTNNEWQGGNPTTWAKHAYWIPSQFCEVDVRAAFKRAYDRVRASVAFNKKRNINPNFASTYMDLHRKGNVLICNSSIHAAPLPPESVDAIVTDPPYGSNVQYLELSHFWHVWNNDLYSAERPEFKAEAISNRKKGFSGAKSMTDYEVNLHKVFFSAFAALKTDKTMTLTFNNKDMGAWLALLLAIFRCGFVLDKRNIVFQDGVKNYKQTAHTKYAGSPYGDFVYTFLKPKEIRREKPISLCELIERIDAIFLGKEESLDAESRAQWKLSMFMASVDVIKGYSSNEFNADERDKLYNHFGKNYLKKIYG